MSCFKMSLLFFGVFAIACKTSKEQPVAVLVAQQEEPKPEFETQKPEGAPQSDGSLETLILGKWDWLKTVCCGRTPATETPETMQMKKSMNFQKGGMVEFSWGGDRSSSQTYKIGYDHTNNNRPFITMEAGRPGLLFIKGDTLIIDYGYMDLETEYYERKK